MSERVTIEAFFHEAPPEILDEVKFLAEKGGDLAEDSTQQTAHVVFKSFLTTDEYQTVLAWAKATPTKAGTGAVVVLKNYEDPFSFSWHSSKEAGRHWSESLAGYTGRFEHLLHMG